MKALIQKFYSMSAKFFAKNMAAIIILGGLVIYCVVYQPEKARPILSIIGLERIDENTPVDIDRAITLFCKEANKKLPKGSNIIIRKINFKARGTNPGSGFIIPPNTENNAIEEIFNGSNEIEEYLHWAVMQEFIKREDINVVSSNDNIMQEIKDHGEIFTINASLEDKIGYNYYRFFISMDKNEDKSTANINTLLKNYLIEDGNITNTLRKNWALLLYLKYLEYSQSKQTKELSIEEVANDSLMEQECITELEEFLLSFFNYDYKGEHSKQIKILFDDKNCVSEMCDEKGKCEPCIDGECPNDCKYKSKCFSYNHYNFDACGSTDIKSNFSIKNCPTGSVWKYNFCEPAGEEPSYSIPENSACINITPNEIKKK